MSMRSLAPEVEPPASGVLARVSVRLLGGVTIVRDGADVPPRTRKARAMLACLALEPRGVSRARLGALLWGDRGEEQARASVRQAIYELRALLGSEALLTSGEQVRLSPEVSNDVTTLAAESDDCRLAALLESAPSTPLQGIDDVVDAFDDWLRDARARVTGDIAEYARAAAKRAEEAGASGLARSLAGQALRFDPFNECAVRIAMRADAALGGQAAMHRGYREFASRLAEALDVQPTAKTRGLYARLREDASARLAQARPDDATVLPPRRSATRRRRLAAAVFALALLAALGIAAWRWLAPPTAEPIIAVLPFDDLSRSPNRYFGGGVAEEIQNLLARAPRIEVLGHVSASEFARNGDILDAARRLHVTHLLDGSVRTEGSRVRVIVRLVRVEDGAQLWSERYDRSLGDVLAVQGDIAAAVMRRFAGSEAIPAAAPVAPNAAVYDRYLAARALMRDRRAVPLREAERSLRQAIALQPRYAPARALLAQVLLLEALHPVSYGTTPYARALAEATHEAQEAAALDPTLGEAQAALGLLSFSNARSVPFYQRAVALDPQRADFHRWLGQALMTEGRFDAALAELRRAVAIDPLWGLNTEHLMVALFKAGRPAEATAAANRFAALSRDELARAQVMMGLAENRGDLANGYRHAARVAQLAPHERQSHFRLASHFASLGERAGALRAMSADDWAGRLTNSDDTDALAAAVQRQGRTSWEIAVNVWNVGDRLAGSGHGAVLVRLFDANFGGVGGYRRGEELDAFEVTPVIVALRDAGRPGDAARLLTRLERQLSTMPPARASASGALSQRALAAAVAGHREQALVLLAEAATREPAQLMGVPYRPIARFAALRWLAADPRMKAIERKVGAFVDGERRKLGWPPLPG